MRDNLIELVSEEWDAIRIYVYFPACGEHRPGDMTATLLRLIIDILHTLDWCCTMRIFSSMRTADARSWWGCPFRVKSWRSLCLLKTYDNACARFVGRDLSVGGGWPVTKRLL